MKVKKNTMIIAISAIWLLYGNMAFAQLNQTFQTVFDYYLRDQLSLSSGVFHGEHYFPAADLADQSLTPALNSLITSNISNFPLSSTVAGITFDFSSGAPVSVTESLGPIFAETAATLGRRKLNLGVNYSYLNLKSFRGLSTEDIRFSFAHEDNDPSPPLGAPGFENDFIDLFLDLDVNAQIFAFSATLGLSNRLDVGVAIPMVNISLKGNSTAKIISFTYGRYTDPNDTTLSPQDRNRREGAAHRFGGTLLDPVLEANKAYDESAMGIGDIALRAKYSLLRSDATNLAALIDIRIPTGKEEDFLGTGETNVRLTGIFSRKINNITPHINLSYDSRPGALDSDELEMVVGFDQKISNGFSFALSFLGTYDINEDEAITLFPGTTQTTDSFTNTAGNTGTVIRNIDLSNVPERTRDNTADVALGFRYAPNRKWSFLGNVLVPMNDGGLRSSTAYTAGLNFVF